MPVFRKLGDKMSRRMLRETHPLVFSEISAVEPASVDPDSLTTGSGRFILWKCRECNQQWRARVVDRTKGGGHGCPHCSVVSRRNAWRIPPAGMSLDDLFPDVASELVEVTGQPGRTAVSLHAGSNRSCVWKCCRCNNEWKTTPNARTQDGSGCPDCARTRSRREREIVVEESVSLAARYPEIAKEFVAAIDADEMPPTSIHPSSVREAKWKCATCAHEWDCSVKKRTSGGSGSGCPRCARLRTINARRVARAGESLADIHPETAAEFVENLDNDLTTSQLKPNSNYRCRWRCRSCKNEWITDPNNRTSGKTGCPACFESRRGEWRRRPDGTSQTAHEALGNIVGEFVRNETSPGFDLTMLRSGSSDKCTWRCATCGHTWVATVNSRARSGSGCRKCYDRRIATHRRQPKKGMSLSDLYPRISQSFVENLTTPGAGPDQLRTRSNDRCQWRCPNGHEWETNVLSRTYGSECPKCTSAGRSRFELEVQCLLEASCGTKVVCDYEVEQVKGASGRPLRVDLFVPRVQLLIDLDPLYTHKAERIIAKDSRKSLLFRTLDYVRLRAEGLPHVPGETVIVNDATKNGIDAWTWTTALRSLIVARGLEFKELTHPEKETALHDAVDMWAQIKGKPRYASAATEHPRLIAEFRRNLTNPSFDLSLRSPSSFDTVEWQCQECDHVWQSSIRNRTRGSDCHACHRRGVNSRNTSRSLAPPGESLAELRPDIAARFINCLTDPSRNPQNLRLKSNLKCEWYCQTGQHIFISPVFAVADRRRCCN
ncbi:zinc-ribbon domain-containing protein [Streptomyces silaceus]|uniref:zinc-ribbon domain-containing protein n=1 Tax=Streptomyces silaceus TaxID=545123 RepID=UPI0012FEA8D6